jgi:hypothetical protein
MMPVDTSLLLVGGGIAALVLFGFAYPRLREAWIIRKTTGHAKRLYSDKEYYIRDKEKRGYDAETAAIHFHILRGECPDCQGKEWYEGPHGGMSVNWYCGNEDCGSGFSVAAAWGDIIAADRIGTWQEFKKRMNIT